MDNQEKRQHRERLLNSQPAASLLTLECAQPSSHFPEILNNIRKNGLLVEKSATGVNNILPSSMSSQEQAGIVELVMQELESPLQGPLQEGMTLEMHDTNNKLNVVNLNKQFTWISHDSKLDISLNSEEHVLVLLYYSPAVRSFFVFDCSYSRQLRFGYQRCQAKDLRQGDRFSIQGYQFCLELMSLGYEDIPVKEVVPEGEVCLHTRMEQQASIQSNWLELAQSGVPNVRSQALGVFVSHNILDADRVALVKREKDEDNKDLYKMVANYNLRGELSNEQEREQQKQVPLSAIKKAARDRKVVICAPNFDLSQFSRAVKQSLVIPIGERKPLFGFLSRHNSMWVVHQKEYLKHLFAKNGYALDNEITLSKANNGELILQSGNVSYRLERRKNKYFVYLEEAKKAFEYFIYFDIKTESQNSFHQRDAGDASKIGNIYALIVSLAEQKQHADKLMSEAEELVELEERLLPGSHLPLGTVSRTAKGSLGRGQVSSAFKERLDLLGLPFSQKSYVVAPLKSEENGEKSDNGEKQWRVEDPIFNRSFELQQEPKGLRITGASSKKLRKFHPQMQELLVDTHCQRASQVSGDLVNFFHNQDEKSCELYGVMIDGQGHEIKSFVFALGFQFAIQSLAKQKLSPLEICQEVNQMLFEVFRHCYHHSVSKYSKHLSTALIVKVSQSNLQEKRTLEIACAGAKLLMVMGIWLEEFQKHLLVPVPEQNPRTAGKNAKDIFLLEEEEKKVKRELTKQKKIYKSLQKEENKDEEDEALVLEYKDKVKQLTAQLRDIAQKKKVYVEENKRTATPANLLGLLPTHQLSIFYEQMAMTPECFVLGVSDGVSDNLDIMKLVSQWLDTHNWQKEKYRFLPEIINKLEENGYPCTEDDQSLLLITGKGEQNVR